MKKLISKGICYILALSLVSSLTVPAFAAEGKGGSNSGIIINDIYYSNAEFQELLTHIEPLEDDEPMITTRVAPAAIIPAWAIGKWVIPAIGAIVITPVAITVGGQIIDSTSEAFSNILNAVKKVAGSKDKGKDKGKDNADKKTKKEKKPTGNRVKDVHNRLKKEGFKKTGQTGSHEKWKKGNKIVTVPNHGSNYEIPIGTLRNMWKQAGWI